MAGLTFNSLTEKVKQMLGGAPQNLADMGKAVSRLPQQAQRQWGNELNVARNAAQQNMARNNIKTPQQFQEYAKQQMPSVYAKTAQAARRMSDDTFGRLPLVGNIASTVLGNAMSAQASGLSRMAQASNDFNSRDPIKMATAVPKAAMGFGGLLAAGTPLGLGASVVSSLPGSKTVQNAAAGIGQAMTGDNTFSPKVKENKWLDLPFLGKVDPAREGGKLVGFTQHPTWKATYPVTGRIMSMGLGGTIEANVPKFFQATVKRLTKGGIEGLIQVMAQYPSNGSREEKAQWLQSIPANVGFGALAEGSFGAAGDVFGTLKNGKVKLKVTAPRSVVNQTIQVLDALDKEVKGTIDIGEQGAFATHPVTGVKVPLTNVDDSAMRTMADKVSSTVDGQAKPATPDIPPELKPLAEEAKKYKSAEEFVKSQGKTSDEIVNLGNDVPKKYDGSLFSREKVDLNDLFQTDHFDAGEYKQPYFKSMMSDVKKGKKLPPIVVDKNGSVIDGNHRLESYLKSSNNFQYVYKEASQTESQLTDLYNKVTKPVAAGTPDAPFRIKPQTPSTGQTLEQVAEASTGWKPGMKAAFDNALAVKDSAKLQELLPEVPPAYQQRFKTEIQTAIKGPQKVSNGVKLPKVAQTFKTAKFNVNTKEEQFLVETLRKLGLDERNVRSFDEMKSVAEELLGDPRKLLSDIESGRVKDSEIVALGDIINTSTGRIAKLTKALKSNPTDTNLLQQLDTEEAVLNQAIKKRLAGGTEAGRTVAAFRILANKTMEPAYWLSKAQRQIGESRMLKPEEVTAINNLINAQDRLGLARFISLLGESSAREKAVSLWKAGLLSSPRTHIANILSNTVFAPLETIKDIPATGFDIARSAITGQPRSKSFGVRSVTEQGRGLLRGATQAKQYLTEGVDPREVAKLDVYRQIRFGESKGGRLAQKYVDGVFRLLGAEDKVFRELAFSRSLADQAGVMAKNQNLSAGQLNDLIANPTKDMVDLAAHDAGVATFNSDNAISDAVRRFKSTDQTLSVAADFTMPFVRTPTNVLLRMIDYTPVGITKTAVQKIIKNQSVSNRELSEAFGRSVTGLAVLWAGYQLAKAGRFQGATPSQEAERSQMYLEGKNPGSILVGDTWYQISKLSPVYPLLAIGASLHDTGSVYEAGLEGVKSIADTPFVSGLAGATQAISDPGRNGQKYLESAIGGVIPNIVKDVARGGDVMRQPDTLLDAVAVGVPGLRQKLPVRVDALGNAIPENGKVDSLINPLRPREATNDPLVEEFSRVGYNLNYVGDTIGGQKLTPEQERAYQVLAGAKVRELTLPVIQSSAYLAKDADGKLTLIEKTVNKAKEQAREEIKPILGSITTGSDRGGKARTFEDQGNVSTLKAFTTDPLGTIGAQTSGQPIRKLRGNSVVLEREKGLSSGDKGNKGTQIDHKIPLALGGSNDQSNLQILTSKENNLKSQVESRIMKDLESGKINKGEAQKRVKNWREEAKDFVSSESEAPQDTLAKVTTTSKGKEYSIASTDKDGLPTTKTITLEIPEYPQLTGVTELDKKLMSKFNGAVTKQGNNIMTLYEAGKMTAGEAGKALDDLKALKGKGSKATGGKKGGTGKAKKGRQPAKISIRKIGVPKVNIKRVSMKMPKIKIKKTPKFKFAKVKDKRISA